MPLEQLEADLFRKWGTRVRTRRVAQALTQEQLATLCGYPQEAISRIEHGRYVMRARLQLALAVALHTPVDELFPWPLGIELAANRIGRGQ